MVEEFTSPLVAEMRANGGVLTRGDVTVKLAEHYGFCWGVERAIAMAYEARSHFPDKTLHITNEIIHNPQVRHTHTHIHIRIHIDTYTYMYEYRSLSRWLCTHIYIATYLCLCVYVYDEYEGCMCTVCVWVTYMCMFGTCI